MSGGGMCSKSEPQRKASTVREREREREEKATGRMERAKGEMQ